MDKWKCWGWRLLKVGLAGLALIIVVKMLGGGTTETESGRKYADHHNWSKESQDFFVKEVVIPDGSKGWVSIAAPPYYRVETSRMFEIEYDLADGRTAKEGPNLPRQEFGDFPSTFDVRATGKGGTLKIWFHRNPQPPPPAKVTSVNMH